MKYDVGTTEQQGLMAITGPRRSIQKDARATRNRIHAGTTPVRKSASLVGNR